MVECEVKIWLNYNAIFACFRHYVYVQYSIREFIYFCSKQDFNII